MSLLAFVAWDTEENGRSKYTNAALESLYRTVDWSRHRLVCIDNGSSCEDTKMVFKHWQHKFSFELITNESNFGQATAINQVWKLRRGAEHLARTDNDILHKTSGWLDLLEECVERDPKIGIIGLKHSDLPDNPNAEGWQKTSVVPLPHEKGQRWIFVEKIRHVLGSAQLVNSALFDKIGYLQAFGPWGWEDTSHAVRCELAGFYSAYLCGAWFEDLDKVKNIEYQSWKNSVSARHAEEHDRYIEEYKSGSRHLYVAG